MKKAFGFADRLGQQIDLSRGLHDRIDDFRI